MNAEQSDNPLQPAPASTTVPGPTKRGVPVRAAPLPSKPSRAAELTERFRQAEARRRYTPGISARAALEHGRGRHGR